jgi:hypothetical protein
MHASLFRKLLIAHELALRPAISGGHEEPQLVVSDYFCAWAMETGNAMAFGQTGLLIII